MLHDCGRISSSLDCKTARQLMQAATSGRAGSELILMMSKWRNPLISTKSMRKAPLIWMGSTRRAPLNWMGLHEEGCLNLDGQHKESPLKLDGWHEEGRLNLDGEYKQDHRDKDEEHEEGPLDLDGEYKESPLELDGWHKEGRLNLDGQHKQDHLQAGVHPGPLSELSGGQPGPEASAAVHQCRDSGSNVRACLAVSSKRSNRTAAEHFNGYSKEQKRAANRRTWASPNARLA
eukprot:1144612-Pelagomonas_calceolata.AAC.3